jgi:hypothetical protein
VTTMRGAKCRVVTAIPLGHRRHAWYFKLKEDQNARDENNS